MNTHLVEPEIVMAYRDGQLAAGEAAGVRAHLETCAECQEIAASLDDVSAQMRAWTVEEPSPQLAWRVAGRAGKPKGKFWWWHWPTAALVTAVLVVAVLPWKRPPAPTVQTGWLPVGSVRTSESNLPLPPAEPRRHDSVAEIGPQAQARTGQLGGVIGGIVSATPMAAPPTSVQRRTQAQFAMEARRGAAIPVPTAPMIARDATLNLTVKDFASVRDVVERIVRVHRGFAQNLALTYQAGRNNLTATLRIPDPELDRTLADLRYLGKVDQEAQNGEDLQAQHVDLAARIANSRVAEARLKELLANRTGKLSDVVEAENELSRVREDIERMQAQISSMENRVEFATVNLRISDTPPVPAPSSVWRGLSEAGRNGLTILGEGLMGVATWLLEYLPTLIVIVLVFFFPVRWLWRKLQARPAFRLPN